MAAPATTDDLLELLDKSRLVESIDFADYLRQRRRLGAMPGRASDLADALVGDGVLTKFQADNLLQGKWMRFFIGPYKVLEAIGAGSSGVVYLCEHDRMRRRVAVKVLQGEKAKDPKALERFHREARAAAALDHPNIVRAFDLGQEDRFHYLVMEYVDGLSLRQLVKNEGPLSAPRAADYLRQAALGLMHAHESGLVHRDIKPSNIMVDQSGVVKILDLGLARFFEDDGDALTQGAVLGNADYIAPEQAVDSHAVDIRADIYSLGATIWYALTGARPARAGLEFLRRPGRPTQESAERSDVPPEVWQILRKMMAPHPMSRYQTPAEVVEAITPWGLDEAARLLLVETPPEPTPPEPTVEMRALRAAAETVPDLPAPPVAPSGLMPPSKSGQVSKQKPHERRFSRKWQFVLATVAGLVAVMALSFGRGGPPPAVPGRGPGTAPYFKPLTPHSP